MPAVNSGDVSNCDDENDSETTMCNSTDNSNEADLGTIDDVESTAEGLALAFPKIVPTGKTSDIVAPSFDSQEHPLAEAAGVECVSETS